MRTKNKTIYPILGFLLIYLSHVAYSIYTYWRIQNNWMTTGLSNDIFLSYFKSQDFLMGFSYALAFAFTIYSISCFLADRRTGAKAAGCGIVVSGLLYLGSCFIIGCCGSPMLAVYLSLFGAKFLGFTKPLIAAITLIAIGLSYYSLKKREKVCCIDNTCKINIIK